jgi:hypothetical protein
VRHPHLQGKYSKLSRAKSGRSTAISLHRNMRESYLGQAIDGKLKIIDTFH